MTARATTHAVVIEVDAPAEVTVGDAFVVSARALCPAGCDLSALAIEVAAPDGATLAQQSAGDGGLHKIALTAPLRSGEHTWRLACSGDAREGAHHQATAVAVSVRVRPHETSLAVWSIPSPVVTGQQFAIKVGAKSAAGCSLGGHRIAVRDEAGNTLAAGLLGDAPWPGTSGLYWTELALAAPADAGMFSWSVKFDATDLAIPHHGTSSSFSIAIVQPPQHRLSVKVVEHGTATPIQNAQVRLGAYRAATGESGLAEIMLPKGSYDLNVWKPGYDAPATTVAIDADVALEIAVTAVPDEDPDAVWQM